MSAVEPGVVTVKQALPARGTISRHIPGATHYLQWRASLDQKLDETEVPGARSPVQCRGASISRVQGFRFTIEQKDRDVVMSALAGHRKLFCSCRYVAGCLRLPSTSKKLLTSSNLPTPAAASRSSGAPRSARNLAA